MSFFNCENRGSDQGFVWTEGVEVNRSVAQLSPNSFHIDSIHPKVVSKKRLKNRSVAEWFDGKLNRKLVSEIAGKHDILSSSLFAHEFSIGLSDIMVAAMAFHLAITSCWEETGN